MHRLRKGWCVYPIQELINTLSRIFLDTDDKEGSRVDDQGPHDDDRVEQPLPDEQLPPPSPVDAEDDQSLISVVWQPILASWKWLGRYWKTD